MGSHTDLAGHQQARGKRRPGRMGTRVGVYPMITGHLLVQGEPWGSVLARKYPMRH